MTNSHQADEGWWVDLGQPCPVCIAPTAHFHREMPDGRLGISVMPRPPVTPAESDEWSTNDGGA